MFEFSAQSHVLRRLYARLSKAASIIAIGTLSVGALDVARADDDRTQLIVDMNGGWVFGDSQPWVEVLHFPSGQSTVGTIRPNTTWGGGVGFITPANRISPDLNSGWDVGVFARFGLTNKESGVETETASTVLQNLMGTDYDPFTDGAATHREEHYFVDFEARRNVGSESMAGARTTLKAGARFAYFNANTNTDFYTFFAPFFATENRTSKFVGSGPRIGFDTELPVSSNVTFDLSGAGSMLFGVKNTSLRTVAFFFDEGVTTSKFHIVPAFEASAALTFRPPSSRAKFSVGVRAEAWLGVYNQTTRLTTNDNADRYQVTPFLRLTTPVGGTASATNAFGGGEFSGDAQSVLEVGARGGYLWRGGNALNGSGPPNDEIEDFPIAGLSGLAALPLGTDWLLQLEADGETGFDNRTIGGVPADDTYAGGYTIGGHVAGRFDQLLFGGFGAAGQTFFHNDSGVDQDADHWVAGAEGRYLTDLGSIAVQVGYLDSSADDQETLSNALFGRVIGQTFFNGGRTMLQAGLGYASGTQDADDAGFVNPTDVLSWDVTLEHQLEHKVGDAAVSVFLSYEGLRVSEQSSSGLTDTIEDNTVMAGLKFRLGAETPYERERRTAPDLPNVARWLGSVPAVD